MVRWRWTFGLSSSFSCFSKESNVSFVISLDRWVGGRMAGAYVRTCVCTGLDLGWVVVSGVGKCEMGKERRRREGRARKCEC